MVTTGVFLKIESDGWSTPEVNYGDYSWRPTLAVNSSESVCRLAPVVNSVAVISCAPLGRSNL